MRRLLPVLVLAYISFITWMAYDNVDSDFMRTIAQTNKSWVVVVALGVLYSGITLVTIWLIRLLYRFAYRLAVPGEFCAKTVNSQGLLMIVMCLFSHALAVWVKIISGLALGAVSFLFPLGLIIWIGMKDPLLRGARKIIVGTPLYLYILADAALIIWFQ
ncbi:MAG: hypothetical protein LBI84_04295 [Propionibacteriaceae bacterium]|jgi:hypothetical protein|nr:hypothetical protein [Propionibacteriaceae bacterium]